MLPTPSTAHVNTGHIYEPAEDSYLFLDTISSESETHFLTQRFGGRDASTPSPIVLEIGTGSGVILAFITAHAGAIFGRHDIIALGTDVNEFACHATKQTVWQASEDANTLTSTRASAALFTTLCADLASPLRPGTADVLIFNPPYVPSPDVPPLPSTHPTRNLINHSDDAKPSNVGSFERDSHLLSLSYAGGFEGMEVANRLLDELPSVLSYGRGVAYILLCQQNDPDSTIRRITNWGREWHVQIVGRSDNKAGWEKLVIIRIWRA